MTWKLWFVAALLALEAIMSIILVNKPRRPERPAIVVLSCVLYGAGIWMVLS